MTFSFEGAFLCTFLYFVDGELILSDRYGLSLEILSLFLCQFGVEAVYHVGALEVLLGKKLSQCEVLDMFLLASESH